MLRESMEARLIWIVLIVFLTCSRWWRRSSLQIRLRDRLSGVGWLRMLL